MVFGADFGDEGVAAGGDLGGRSVGILSGFFLNRIRRKEGGQEGEGDKAYSPPSQPSLKISHDRSLSRPRDVRLFRISAP